MSHIKPLSKFGFLVILLLINYHSSLSSLTDNWILYVTNTSGNEGQPPSYAVLPITIPSGGTPTQNLATISLAPHGPNPMDIAITPNSQLAVVVASDGVSNEVALLNLATNAVIYSLTNAGDAPVAVAITPDGSRAYVPNLYDNTVAAINIENNNTLTLNKTIPVGSSPNSVAIGPVNSNSSGMAYVGNGDNTSVTVINTTNNLVVTTIHGAGSGTNGNPMSIAIHPNGNVIYVTSYRDNTVAVIDPSTNLVKGAVSVGTGAHPRAIVVSSDGTKAYVSNFSANTVTVLNLSSTPLPLPTVSGTITGFNQPSNLAITPDANTIYVSDPAHNRLAILNTPTNMITGQITQSSANLQLPSMVPFFPGGFVVTPDQAPSCQFTSTSSLLSSANATASFQVTFDASGSSSPVGTIVSYAWNFGDGTTAVTSNPIITHTYSQPGFYTVTLTVTNSAGTSTTQIFTGRTVSNNGGPSATLTETISVGSTTPQVQKTFAPDEICIFETTLITVTLINPANLAASITSFTDHLPDDLMVVRDSASNTCGGSLSTRHRTISLTGGSIPPASSGLFGSCQIQVRVKACEWGRYTNHIRAGALQTSNGSNQTGVVALLRVSDSHVDNATACDLDDQLETDDGDARQ